MSTMTEADTRPATRQKVGIGLAGIFSLSQVPTFLIPTPEGEPGPPFFILVLGSVLGLVGVVAAIQAWRGSSVATRILAGAMIVSTLTGLPALFVDGIPAAVRIFVGVSVALTIAAVYLMFSPPRRPAAS
jgi:hypothetical protein